MAIVQFQAIKEELRGLLAERLSIRARTFPRAVSKAGRLLPASARAAAGELIALEARMAHPKLAALTDPGQAKRAAATIREALARHRPGARAGQQRSLLLAEIGFRALVVVGAGLAFLRWQGLV